MAIPHYKISYAQNYEDLVLAGILKQVQGGFYADVGANHPELDSVTRIFYDKGWSGINIEPNEALHAELVRQRTRDINLRVAAASQPGTLSLRVYEGRDGLSTISTEVQAMHASAPQAAMYSDVVVDVVSLADVFARHRPSGDIHFLKIDVEGLELEVLLGNDWSRFRPWVMCIERNLDPARRAAIETYARACRYEPVFFDGINEFFMAQERMALWHAFSYAADVVLDGVPVNYIFVKAMMELQQSAAQRP